MSEVAAECGIAWWTAHRMQALAGLAVIPNTQPVDAITGRNAILNEARLRGIGDVVEFSVPPNWGPAYDKAVRKVTACERHRSIAEVDVTPRLQLGTVPAIMLFVDDPEAVGRWWATMTGSEPENEGGFWWFTLGGSGVDVGFHPRTTR